MKNIIADKDELLSSHGSTKREYFSVIMITLSKIPVIVEFSFLPPLILHASPHYIPVLEHIPFASLHKFPVLFVKKPAKK